MGSRASFQVPRLQGVLGNHRLLLALQEASWPSCPGRCPPGGTLVIRWHLLVARWGADPEGAAVG